MLKIGLTGGIGSGKSTVATLFAELDVPIIDSDFIAKEVLLMQKILVDKIIEHFGPQILDTDNQLDRRKLRTLVFSDIKERKWLEQLLHPIILEEIKQKISQLTVLHIPYCIVVIPLLTEVLEARQLVDRVLVVDVSEEIQLKRTVKRDELIEADVKKIVASQALREKRLSMADDVIQNETDLEALKQKVQQLHQQYLRAATFC